MTFDPLDNLFGAGILIWIAVGLVWFGVIAFFTGLPEWMTRKGQARRRRLNEERRARNDPPT